MHVGGRPSPSRGPMYAVIETGGKQYTVELARARGGAARCRARAGDQPRARPAGRRTARRRRSSARGGGRDSERRVLRGTRRENHFVSIRPKARRASRRASPGLTVLKIPSSAGLQKRCGRGQGRRSSGEADREKVAKAAARQAAEDAALAEKLKAREKAPRRRTQKEARPKHAPRPPPRSGQGAPRSRPRPPRPQLQGQDREDRQGGRGCSRQAPARTKKDE